MALATPIIDEIAAFDVNIGTTITFGVNGGDQVVKNEIRITNENDIIVYYDVVSSYTLEHIIPPNASRLLFNGRPYKASIRTYDILNNVSAWSNWQPFYCYTTPTISFNVINGQTVYKSNVEVNLIYKQKEGEAVEYALIQLYDGNNALVYSSGKLHNLGVPPLTFPYLLKSLNNHTQYKLVGTVVTVNGTVIQSSDIIFFTNYPPIIEEKELNAILDSCNGYINLHTNSYSLTDITGTSNPDPAIYIDNTMVDLMSAPDIDNEIASWAKWDKINVPTDFLLRIWFYPAKKPCHILTLSNESDDYHIEISQNRGSTQDYISIRSDNGEVLDKGLGVHCNGHTKIFLWLRVLDNNWTIETEILSTESTIAEWDNINTNIMYNADSDIIWGGESFETYTPPTHNNVPVFDILTELKIGNGIFDALYLTRNVDIPYSNVIPSYTSDTIIGVDFNGNLSTNTPHYTKLVLKRRDENLLRWLILSEAKVSADAYTFINYNDGFIPTGVEQIYRLEVYTADNNIPTETYTTSITPKWGKIFISDKETRFALNYGVIYSNNSQNIQNGVLMPIGATYPIVIQNANGNYRSGSVQFKVLGYQFEVDKTLNRTSIVQQTNDVLEFLTNGKAKCLTDFNGNIYLLKVINSPQISYDANWGNGVTIVSFDWVEQGKYTNYNDMLELGLLDDVTIG